MSFSPSEVIMLLIAAVWCAYVIDKSVTETRFRKRIYFHLVWEDILKGNLIPGLIAKAYFEMNWEDQEEEKPRYLEAKSMEERGSKTREYIK
jgi:hypothetical protein